MRKRFAYVSIQQGYFSVSVGRSLWLCYIRLEPGEGWYLGGHCGRKNFGRIFDAKEIA